MNTEQPIITDRISAPPLQAAAKETYNAPQIKMHGKLERLTLQDGYPAGGGAVGGGTGGTPEE